MWLVLVSLANAEELCRWNDVPDCRAGCEERGERLSCARFGKLQRRENDPAGARKSFQASCDAGYATACNLLGLMWDEGEGGPRDDSKAFALYTKACDAGAGVACFNLGGMYDIGEGVARSVPTARTYYEKACEKGSSAGCEELMAMYETGDGAPRDLSKALSLFGRSLQAHAQTVGHLECEEGTVLIRQRAYMGYGVEWFCGTVSGRRPVKHGPMIEWASAEDEAAGPEHGVIVEKGYFEDGEKHGLFERFTERGVRTKRVEYSHGEEGGLLERWNTDGSLASKTYNKWLDPGAPELKDEPTLQGERVRMVKTFDSDGTLEKIEYRDEQGRFHGPYRRYDDNGKLTSEAFHRHGPKHGMSRNWHYDSDQLAEQSYWVDGERHGPQNRWDREGASTLSGNWVNGQKQGPWYENSHNSRYRGTYDHGVPIGPWQELHDDGTVACQWTYDGEGRTQGEYRCFHENGKRASLETRVDDACQGEVLEWHEDGKTVAARGRCDSGTRVGEWAYFYENGKPDRKGSYDADGCETGTWVGWYDNGNKREEGAYDDCDRRGPWKEWHDNGTPSRERTYDSEGCETGPEKRWHDNGQLEGEGSWRRCERVGTWKRWREDGTRYSEITYGDAAKQIYFDEAGNP